MNKSPRKASSTLKRRKIGEGFTQLEMKTYCKARIIKTVRFWCMKREVDLMEQDREFQEDPDLDGG